MSGFYPKFIKKYAYFQIELLKKLLKNLARDVKLKNFLKGIIVFKWIKN